MKRVYRDRFDKKISGVCGGLAQYFKFDPSLIRLICILLAFLTGGLFVIAYLICWMLFPLGPRAYVENNYKRLYRSRKDRKIAGICGGLGHYFKIDANIIRLVVLILMFATGIAPFAISYLIGIAVIPEQPTSH